MALMVFTLFINAIDQATRAQGDQVMIDIQACRTVKDVLFRKAKVLWTILWNQRKVLFDANRCFAELDTADTTAPKTVQSAIAECLAALDKLFYPELLRLWVVLLEDKNPTLTFLVPGLSPSRQTGRSC